jgi:hypothetical protein
MKVALTIAVLASPLLAYYVARSQRIDTQALDGGGIPTTSGTIIGHDAPNNTQVTEYLGIPYAAAPIGNKRFFPPSRFESNTVFNASQFVCSLVRGGIPV